MDSRPPVPPSVPGSDFLDHPGPIPFAHRGGASEAPENTMPAFQRAVDLGFRYLETDVHATVDGVLVAFHDDRLDRVTDRTGLVAELPWVEVARARVGGTEPIPRLEELFEAWPEARFNLDPKSDGAAGPLIEFLRERGRASRVCVTAFDDARVARIRDALDGRVCTGAGPLEVLALLAAIHGEPAHPQSQCLQVMDLDGGGQPFCTPELVSTAHRHGLVVHVWTVDDPDRMEALLDMGVDGLMTDRPSVLRRVLRARGQWY